MESGLPAAPVEKAVPVETYTTKPDAKLSEVVMLFNPAKLERVKDAMNAVGVTGMTVTNVMGCGTQKGHVRKYRGVEIEELNLNPKMKLEMVISAVPVETVIAAAREALYTGNIGDGKIFVYDVEDAVKVRTGARGYERSPGHGRLIVPTYRGFAIIRWQSPLFCTKEPKVSGNSQNRAQFIVKFTIIMLILCCRFL